MILRYLGKLLVGALLFQATIVASPQASAQHNEPVISITSQQYQELVQRLEATESELQALRSRTMPQLSSSNDGTTWTSTFDQQPEIQRLPSIESRVSQLEEAAKQAKSPKYPTVNLTGFFHYDTGHFYQDDASRATLGDIQDGSGFRRARLAATGSVAANMNYILEMDFGVGGRPSFMDVWGEVTMLPVLGTVRIGHFRQPFSMDALTSIKSLTFLERSLPFQALLPFRRIGVMAYDNSEDLNTTWAYSVYRTDSRNYTELGDTLYATNLTDNGDISASTRVTHLLWYDEPADGRFMLHIGGAYNYSVLGVDPTNDTRTYRANAIPEFFVGDPTAAGNANLQRTPVFVDTGAIPAYDLHLLGVELAGVYGPAYFQAEYMQTYVNRTGGARSLAFDGAYAQVGYFLTGEHRAYNRKGGVFDRVVPFEDFFAVDRGFCGWGAWELAFRWSYIDLNNDNVAGGKLTNLTTGLNWYWNPHAKLQFNWIHAMLSDRGTAMPPGRGGTDIYALRFQVDF